MKLPKALVAPLALLGSLSSCGDGQANRASADDGVVDDSFVQAFIGNCVQSFPDISKIDAAAVALKWTRVTDPSILKMLAPPSESGSWSAYSFKNGSDRLVLAVSTSTNTNQVRFCTLIGQPASVDATRTKLVELLAAQIQENSEENGQRYRIYKFDNDEQPTVLSFIDAVPMGMRILNATTMILPRSDR